MTPQAVLRVPTPLWADIAADLLSTPELERAAVGFAGLRRRASATQLFLRDWMPVPADEYLVQLGYHLEVSPVFWARAAKRCRADHEAMVIIHSHPRDPELPQFSPSDDAGETSLIPKVRARAGVPVAAVVLSPGGTSGRLTEGHVSVAMDVQPVGELPVPLATGPGGAAFDRQVRALGREGHALLRNLRVGVVGAGGLGSHVLQQLVHLGVGEVTVIDPDRVAVSNLSRLVGASYVDVWLRRHKTRVSRRMARRMGGKTRIDGIEDSIISPAVARRLLECDLVFGCTDNQLSRTVLNAIAFQYYIPVADLGVELQVAGAIGGRVSWLAPGGACLWCMGVLDSEAVRIEQLSAALRRDEEVRGYIRGADEPAPAVISINGVIASLGVTEMLARITGFAGTTPRSSLLLYRLVDGVVRHSSPRPTPGCPTCSVSGVFGAGDLAAPPWAV
ncbi:MAG: HesA/MoeB/ThiF family protein [Acidimicrobiales bacterium]